MRKLVHAAVLLSSVLACQPSGTTKADPTSVPTQAAAVTPPPSPPDEGQPPATAPASDNVVAVPWPSLDFVNDPGGHDPKAIALSFDDGSDGMYSAALKQGKATYTSYVLDQLKALGVHATFFINGNRASPVVSDPIAQADIRRMLAEGHAIGSHTMTHPTFDSNTLTAEQVASEWAQNQAAMRNPNVLGPTMPAFSLYRSPYGVPFQDNARDVAIFAPAGVGSGVHVGWGIDSQDWQCALQNKDSSCILNTMQNYLSRGASGVVLMHSIYKLSGDTLPAVVQMIRANGYHFVMVEDFVVAKYGASSAALLAANTKANFSKQAVIDAALAATGKSKWVLGTVE